MTKKNLIRVIAIGATILVVILLVLNGIAGLYLSRLTERFVREVVRFESDGLYRVKSVDLNWEILARRLTIKDLNLQLDSLRLADLQTNEAQPGLLVELNIAELSLRQISILDGLRDDNWSVRELSIRQPNLNIYKTGTLPGRSDSSIQPVKSLYGLLQPYLNTLKIDHLQIEEGIVTYRDQRMFSQDAFEAKNLSVEIDSLRLDSTSGRGLLSNLFQAEAVRVQGDVDSYSLMLPDSSYMLRVGRIGLSTEGEELFLENLKLQPNYRFYQRNLAQGETPPNLFEVNLELLSMGQIDFEALLFKRKVDIGTARFVSPRIVQLSEVRPDSVADTEFDPEKIFAAIQPFFQSIRVGGIALEKGDFSRISNLGERQGNLHLGGIGAFLEDFRIDSSLLKDRPPLLLCEAYDFKVDSFRVDLQNRAIEIKGNATGLSSTHERFYANDFDIHSLRRSKGSSGRTRSRVLGSWRTLQIEGFDLESLVFDGDLDLDRLILMQPKVDITNPLTIQRSQVDSLGQLEVSSLLGGLIDRIALRECLIKNGSVSYNEGFRNTRNLIRAAEIDFMLGGFEFDTRRDPGKRLRPLLQEILRVSLKVDDYAQSLPDSSYRIKAGHIVISTTDSLIEADSLQLIPLRQDKSVLARSFVSQVKLRGFSLLSLYDDQYLRLDSLLVFNPSISMNIGASAVSDSAGKGGPDLADLRPLRPLAGIVDSIRVRALRFQDGSLEVNMFSANGDSSGIRIPQISLALQKVYLDSLRTITTDGLLFSDTLHLVARGISETLADNSELNLRRFDYRFPERRVSLNELEFHSPPGPNQLKTRFPVVRLTQVDPQEILKQKRLHFQQLTLLAPEISAKAGKKKENTASESLSEQLLSLYKDWSAIGLDRLVIQEGFARLEVPGSPAPLRITGVGLKLDSIRLDSGINQKGWLPVSIGEPQLQLKTEKIEYWLPDSSHHLMVNTAEFNEQNNTLQLEDLELTPISGRNKETSQTWVRIPRIDISWDELRSAFNQRDLELKSVVVWKPYIRNFNPGRTPTKKPDVNALKPGPGFQKVIQRWNRISIADLQVRNARVELLKANSPDSLDRDGPPPIILPDLSVELRGVTPDTGLILAPGREFYADWGQIELRGYKIPVDKNTYHLQADVARFHFQDSVLTLDSLELEPLYSHQAFFDRFNFGRDSLHIKTRRTIINGFGLHRFLRDGSLNTRVINMEGLHIYAFKNKSFPPKPDKAPPTVHQIVRAIKPNLKIDSIHVSDGKVEYWEYVPRFDETGYLFFSDINASSNQVTNIPALWAEEPSTELKGTANLLGDCRLFVDFDYFLADTAGKYTVYARADTLDLREVNSLSEPTMLLSVRSGKMRGTESWINFSNHTANGRMRFLYENLKVSIFKKKKKEDEDDREVNRMMSGIANALVVRSANPNGAWVRIGKIEYEVEKNKGVVGHWVQALANGFKSSTGLSKKGDKEGILGLIGRKRIRDKTLQETEQENQAEPETQEEKDSGNLEDEN